MCVQNSGVASEPQAEPRLVIHVEQGLLLDRGARWKDSASPDGRLQEWTRRGGVG